MTAIALDCPNCGDPSSMVTNSRPRKSGILGRRRQCNGCGERYGTVEIHEVEFDSLMALRASVESARKALQDAIEALPKT